MKKVIALFTFLVFSATLSSCVSITKGASAVSAFATMSNDRRTMGQIIDDEALYAEVGKFIIKDPKLDEAHINFNVYNQSILLTGEAPSDDIKNYLEEQIQQLYPNIKELINDISIMPNSSYISRAKDGIITLQVEALFLNQEVFYPTHVFALTENRTVYLMGAVTKREAEHAANVASKAKNVDKVVKVFTYLLVRPAKEIEKDKAKKIKLDKIKEIKAKKAEIEAKQIELDRELFEISII